MKEYEKCYLTLFNDVSDTIRSLEAARDKYAETSDPGAREDILRQALIRAGAALKMAQQKAEECYLSPPKKTSA